MPSQSNLRDIKVSSAEKDFSSWPEGEIGIRVGEVLVKRKWQ